MRSLGRWAVLSLLAAPVGAWAVSLGEIDVRSALNQPLAAEIALTATAEELEALTISLASPETFARYGLDRPAFLTGLAFRIGTNPAGNRVVFVTSAGSIAEPFVELLIEASSRNGRFLRQYTLFLDPPTLLPASAVPAPIEPARTRVPEPGVGEIPRPAPVREPEGARPSPGVEPRTPAGEPETVTPPASAAPPVTSAAPRAPLPGTYGEVERGETLWGITTALRPSGVTMNQMMVAIYEANPQAFNSNMNILRRGAILRIPELSEIQAIDARAATAEARAQTDTWEGRVPQQEPRLILEPPADDAVALVRDSTSAGSAAPDEVGEALDETPSPEQIEPGERLLDIQDPELAALQDRGITEPEESADTSAAGADPGVQLEAESVFADEPPIAVEETPPVADTEAAEPPPVVAPSPTGRAEPSLFETLLGWIAMPIVWMGAGGAVVVVGILLFLRRRGRTEPEDVTGKWEALEAELDDDVAREATARLRSQAQNEDFVVHEQPAEPEPTEAPAPAAPAKKVRGHAAPAAMPKEQEASDQTLSSQTVINLDQADPIAEADFHMAYGLYDQAADLVSKAVKEHPKRRDLKLKLLEVFFVWGNKESFLKTAKMLREESGTRPDPDWDKVVIMGKQICPDEPLFAAATAAAAEVDVDLDAGEAPALDLSFDADESAGGGVDLDLGAAEGDFTIAQSGSRATAKPAARAPATGRGLNVDIDIGTRTQAGLEAALLALDDKASRTTPDLEDALASTQESPTGETPRSGFDDWSAVTMESPTMESEVPATVEQRSFRGPPTVEAPTIESTRPRERKGTDSSGEFTAELNLDDLGLDVDDVKNLPQSLSDSAGDDAESDTRRQRQITVESDLLSATGVTQVLHEEDPELEHSSTAILSDSDATMMAPGFEGDGTVRTEVIERPIEETLAAGAARKKRGKSDLDLDLDDFSAALQGGDTVEQPHAATFETGIFQGGGSTPIDLDIGADVRGDDEPTGTEEVGSVDPQTMTEVGTKLDLARAYIDMGDPEGARSILEEVLGEGDPGQRREAQTLIDALPA